MIFEIFRKFLVLYFCAIAIGHAQVIDNGTSIELSQTDFPLERPFTISVIISNNETRPVITFPDIVGFMKKGVTTSTTPVEINEKTIISQVITQTYQAKASGRFQLAPFTIIVNGQTIHSEGATLFVRASTTVTAPANVTQNSAEIVTDGAAFLSLRASKPAIFTGESLALTLSFFIADNYPYVLNFTALDKQLQAILKKIRPVNSWEENTVINELKPVSVVIRGKKFREFRMYHSVFFPLANQALRLPAVSLQLARLRPVIGPPSAQTENIVFTSKPLVVAIKPLPAHALRGKVSVGSFQLEENLERPRIKAGQSVRYTFTIVGEGNIATLPAPSVLNQREDLDVFPPEERHSLSHTGDRVTGHKSFTYFIVPHQNGSVPLTNRFQWVYFDPETARYDTLLPRLQLQVGSQGPIGASSIGENTIKMNEEKNVEVLEKSSIYAGIEAMDSTHQSISLSVLVRAVANVLIVIMLLGMIFVFFKGKA